MTESGLPLEADLHLLECPICLEPLQQPKSLPCFHSFCQECLGTYINKELSKKVASATSFPCPVCRRMTHPVNQAEGTVKLAGQFSANSVILDLIKLKGDQSKPLFCKPCQTKGNIASPAKFWCKTMDVNFCETCKVQHHDILHNDCEILDITVYGDTLFKQDNLVPRCEPHGDKLVRYCEDHKLLCCNECVIEDHRGCGNVLKTTEYIKKLKAGSQIEEMQAALKKGAEDMELFVKDFDEQLKAMVQNQEIALKSISDLRQKVDKRLDKLQRDITDKLVTLFKQEKRDMEASMQQCQQLMNEMRNTLTSFAKAAEKNDSIESIILYRRGQAELESCKTLVTEMKTSFKFVIIKHQTVAGNDDNSGDALGEIVIRKQPRCIPNKHEDKACPMAERRVKEIGKFNIKVPSDKNDCCAVGVVYLPCGQIIVSDSVNEKIKLYTDKGRNLDELTVPGQLCDMCLVDNNTYGCSCCHRWCTCHEEQGLKTLPGIRDKVVWT